MTDPFNYKRAYQLSVGKPPSKEYIRSGVLLKEGSVFGSSDGIRPSYVENEFSVLTPSSVLDYRRDYNGRLIDDLQIEVSINKNATSKSSSSCVIKIYNLSEDTKSFICGVNNNVILKAGYSYTKADDLPMIYTGQVSSYNTERIGNDTVTTLYCKDGYTPSTLIKAGVYWSDPEFTPAPRTYGDLIRHIASMWEKNGIKGSSQTVITDLPARYVEDISPDDLILEGGYTYQGYLKHLTDLVAKEVGYNWYIDNSILYFEPKYYNKKTTKRTFILDESQVISLRDQDDKGKSQLDNKGIQLELLLDGRFETGKFVEIPFGERSGVYKIVSVSYKLSYRGKDWNMSVMCTKEESND